MTSLDEKRRAPTATVHPAGREDWRKWLSSNHAKEDGVWLIFNKRDSGLKRLTYEAAVEEALCYGWIDSLVRRIDEKHYAQKFTPRRPGSRWSLLNRQRVARLIREGRMTGAGLRAMKSSTGTDIPIENPSPTRKARLRPPPYFVRALKADGRAWTNFQAMAPSYRRLFILWITAARREETRAARVLESVERLSRNEKLGLK